MRPSSSLTCVVVLLHLRLGASALLSPLSALESNASENVVESYIGYPSSRELIHNAGFESESYDVTTEDGYILRLFRIVNPETVQGKPVLIVHGIFHASDAWMLLGREMALPFLLADQGYDVWLGDLRGNCYSRAHSFLNVSSPSFWDFSFEEVGRYDIPAFVDHILSKTGYSDLFYIGHSMGSTVLLVMAAFRPEYNNKITAAFLLSPIATVVKFDKLTPTMKTIGRAADSIYSNRLQSHSLELLPRTSTRLVLVQMFCSTFFTEGLCMRTADQLFGLDRFSVDSPNVGYYLSSFPSGTSAKVFHHYSQIHMTGEFKRYDYKRGNLLKYNQTRPPMYDLSRVTLPIHIYFGPRDRVMDEDSAHRLAEMLPNVQEVSPVKDKNFGHADVIFGKKSRRLLYDPIMRTMNQYMWSSSSYSSDYIGYSSDPSASYSYSPESIS